KLLLNQTIKITLLNELFELLAPEEIFVPLLPPPPELPPPLLLLPAPSVNARIHLGPKFNSVVAILQTNSIVINWMLSLFSQ
ncbi:hypothetical protein BLA29_011688, partial [Euroglyphus maynei]